VGKPTRTRTDEVSVVARSRYGGVLEFQYGMRCASVDVRFLDDDRPGFARRAHPDGPEFTVDADEGCPNTEAAEG
jgi:hypothetical protein